MKICTRIKCWMLAGACPNFWRDMPEDRPGKFVAAALRTNAFGPPREIYTEVVDGFVNAYIKARSLALKLDLITPYANGELGVQWAIREHKQ